MQGNWFAVNRSLVEHPVLSRKPLWGWSWVVLLSHVTRQTGEVCLTEVYRELKSHFTHSQWRHFVNTLQKEEMLSDVVTQNLGKDKGHVQTAVVTNWHKYQPENSRKTPETAQSTLQSTCSASAEHFAEQNTVQEGEKEVSAQSTLHDERSASAEHFAVYNKNIFQEVKEKKEDEDERPQEKNWGSLFDRLDAHERTRKFALDIIQTDADVWQSITNFVDLCGDEKVKDQTLHAWIAAFAKDIDRHGPEKVKTTIKTIVTNPHINNPWGYYETCMSPPKTDRAASEKFSAGGAAQRPRSPVTRRGANKFEDVIAEKRRKDAEWFAKHGYGGQDGSS